MPWPIGTDLTVLLPVLAVTATGLIILVVDWFTPADDPRPPTVLAVLGLLLASLFLWLSWGDPAAAAFTRQVTGPGGRAMAVSLLRGDAFARFIEGAVLIVALATVLASTAYVRRRGIAQAEYYALLVFATAGMMLLGLANDLIVLFLALESFSIALYILSGFVRGDRLGQEAALKYFVLGAFAAGFLLYGIALLFAATGTTDLAQIGQLLAEASPARSAPGNPVAGVWPTAYLGLALLLVGLGFKVAIVPFHQWAPDVYEGAPMTVTAFMAAGTKVAAFAALIRVLVVGFPATAGAWVPLLGALAVITMLVGNLAALVQADLKRMLGYSAVAHTGYILVAVVATGPEGTAAALFYLLAYALMNLGAFAVLLAIGPVGPSGRDATNLNDLAGLAVRHPGLTLAMTVFLLSLTGLPPTAGFLGKWYIFRAAVAAGLTPLAIAVVLNSVLSAFYYLRPIILMYSAEAAEARDIAVPAPSAVVVAVLALVVGLAVVLAVPLVSGARVAAGIVPVAESGAGGAAGVFIAPPNLER